MSLNEDHQRIVRELSSARLEHEQWAKLYREIVHYEDAGDGWILATIPEVPGAISQGRTRTEARQNIIDALQVALTPDDQLAGRPA